MDMAARIAVVIVTYNSAAVLPDCLRSLTTLHGVHLSAVAIGDNNSQDDTLHQAEEARAEGLPLTVVQLGRNAGYAAGINAGISALNLDELDAVFVMNPDCRLTPDSLDILVKAMAQPTGEPRRGITVPMIRYPDGTLQLSLRRAPTVGRAVAEAVIGGKLAGRIGTLGELVTDPAEYERPGPAAWATGAAMLISAAAIRDIGDWDESFFLYSEETDFALRAADRGWALWYEPNAVVIHIGGESRTNLDLNALLIVNKVRLFRRRSNALAGSAYYAATLLGATVRGVAGRKVSRNAVAALMRPNTFVGRTRERASAAARPPQPPTAGIQPATTALPDGGDGLPTVQSTVDSRPSSSTVDA
jgi:N-acetylglucosaminyl-diphospho-decaprenol L-rhamnosyltransferase